MIPSEQASGATGHMNKQISESTACDPRSTTSPPISCDSEYTLSIIIISYNTAELTCCLLASLPAASSARYQIIIIDNASSDDSVRRIRQQFPDTELHALPTNIGFGAAVNLASHSARGRFLLLLNPDTILPSGSIDRLLDFARRRPNARIWGGRTLHADQSLNPTSCWRRMTLWSVFCRAAGLSHFWPQSRFMNPEAYPHWKRDDERPVDIVTGCFALIERSLWEELNGFDPAYFVYGEEADLCLRARLLGAEPAITPEATIVHLSGASQADMALRRIQMLSARIRLIRYHFRGWQAYIAIRLIRAHEYFSFTFYRWKLPTFRDHDDWRARVWAKRHVWWNGY